MALDIKPGLSSRDQAVAQGLLEGEANSYVIQHVADALEGHTSARPVHFNRDAFYLATLGEDFREDYRRRRDGGEPAESALWSILQTINGRH